jgi:hypothetical protein
MTEQKNISQNADELTESSSGQHEPLVIPPQVFELKEIPEDDEKFYQVEAICSDCQTLIDTSKRLTGKDLHKNWIMIVMGAGLANGACPKGCEPTYADLNIHTKLRIVRAAV